MEINEVITALLESPINQVQLVLIINDGAVQLSGFSHEGSWRGRYYEPCVFMGDNHSKHELLEALHRLVNNNYQGWKGGEFTYTSRDDLNIEPTNGQYSGDGYINRIVPSEDGEYLQLICIKE